MTSSAWQLVVAVVIVAGAALVLVRRAVRLWKTSGAGGCGSGTCKSCPSGESSPAPSELIQMTPTTKRQ